MNEKIRNDDTFPRKFGRYDVVDIIGEGGMGIMFLARDPLLERDVAVKAIKLGITAHSPEMEDFLQRFLVEAKSSAKLNHPSIVSVHDAGDEKGIPWIAFEYVRGESLEATLQREVTLSMTWAIAIVRDIAAALQHAHESGIIHRDVKPANILIDRQGRAKLADFGIAKAPWSIITKSGMTVGSPGYMSPEQVSGLELDRRSDIFSLGVIFYRMLSGFHPFQRDSIQATVMATISGDHRRLTEINPGIPAIISDLIERCLVADRGKRLSSAREFIELLGRSVNMNMACDQELAEAVGVHCKDRDTAPVSLNGIETAALDPIESEPALAREHQRKIPHKDDDISEILDAVLDTSFTDTGQRRWAASIERLVPALIVIFIVGTAVGFYKFSQNGTGWESLTELTTKKPTISGVQSKKPVDTMTPVEKELRHSDDAVLRLQEQALHGSRREAFDAAKVLREKSLSWPEERFIDWAETALRDKNVPALQQLVDFFLDHPSTEHYGLFFQGWSALQHDHPDEASGAFSSMRQTEAGRDFLADKSSVILLELAPLMEREEAPDNLIRLIALDMNAADHAQILGWLNSSIQHIRWNAVAIRRKAGLPVDMVEIYIRDLLYGNDWGTRKNAVDELGKLNDERAIPALMEAEKKKLRDPVVANAARSVLNRVFGDREKK